MEEDFARLLRSMTHGPAHDASSDNGGPHQQLRSEADELNAVLRGRAQDRLTAIRAALRRMDTGDYGRCARCGSRIAFGRLAVMPEATRCIACG